MPRHKGRPDARTVTIADCASFGLHENPTTRCPHGKFWWESDGDRLLDELQAQMCREPGCDSTEYHPHEGESLTLREERTFAGRAPIRELMRDVRLAGDGLQLPDDFETRLRDIIQDWVVAWTWTGIDGTPLPLPRDDWDTVAAQLEYAELMWVVEAALHGKDPREALYRPLAEAPTRSSASG